MKKLLKILGFVAAGFVVLIFILVLCAILFFPTERAKMMAIERSSEALGQEVVIDDVKLSFWGGLGIKLYGVRIGNPSCMTDEDDLLKADVIDVKLSILPLLSKEYRVKRLIIDKPKISMRRLSDGCDNFSFADTGALSAKDQPPSAAPAEAKAAMAALSFDQLEIRNGILQYANDKSGDTVRLSKFNLVTNLENPRKDAYHSEGGFSVNEISLSGDMPLPPVEVSLDWTADYDANQKYLSLKEAELGIGRLNLDLDGDLSHEGNNLKARASIRSGKINVDDLLSLVSPERLVVLEDFDINGDFSLNADVNYKRGQERPLSYSGTATITDMKVGYVEIDGELQCERTLLDFKPDNIRMIIEEGTFNGKPLKGNFVVNDFDDPTINADVAGELDLVFLKPFLPIDDNHNLAGGATLDVKLFGKVNELEKIDISGNIKIPNGRYSSSLLPEPIDSFLLDAYFDRRVLRIKQFGALSKSCQLSFSGRITDLVPYIVEDSAKAEQMKIGLDGKLHSSLNLDILNGYLPPEGSPKLTGKLEMEIAVIGDMNHPTTLKPRGTVSVTDGYYSDTLIAEPIRKWQAKLRVVPDTVYIDELKAQFVSSNLSLHGTFVKPIPYLLPFEGINRSRFEKPLLLFELTSSRFNVDSLFPEAVPGISEKIDDETTTEIAIDSVSPVMLPDIVAKGQFSLDTLVYCRVDFTGVTGDLTYSDRKVVCSDVVGKVYSGDVSGHTTIDLANFELPMYKGTFRATQIEADDFIRRFTKFGGHLFGKFDLSGDYQAKGWESDKFLNSLSMNSKAQMQNGRIVTSGAIYKTLSMLADQVGSNISKEQTLKDARTNITVRDGKVRLDTLLTSLGNVGDIILDGYYSFNNDVSYSGNILLSAKTTERMKSNKGLLGTLSGLLNDRHSNRIALPFTVSGTINHPTAKIDYSALSKKAGENLVEDAGKKLLDLFKKK